MAVIDSDFELKLEKFSLGRAVEWLTRDDNIEDNVSVTFSKVRQKLKHGYSYISYELVIAKPWYTLTLARRYNQTQYFPDGTVVEHVPKYIVKYNGNEEKDVWQIETISTILAIAQQYMSEDETIAEFTDNQFDLFKNLKN